MSARLQDLNTLKILNLEYNLTQSDLITPKMFYLLLFIKIRPSRETQNLVHFTFQNALKLSQ